MSDHPANSDHGSGIAPSGNPNKQLIQRTARNDLDAFHMLYESSRQAVYAFALAILRSGAAAADATEDTFRKLRASAPQYKSSVKPAVWILSITRNVCLMHLRSKKMEGLLPLDEPLSDVGSDTLPDSEDRTILQTAFHVLTKEECRILMLHAAELSFSEIAEVLPLPQRAVQDGYNSAISKLCSSLTSTTDEDINAEMAESHLRSAFAALVPNCFDMLREEAPPAATGGEWYLKQATPTRKKNRFAAAFISIITAAALLLLLVPLYILRIHVDSRVYLDINPSIELQLNLNDRVIRAVGLNPDGETLLEKTDLKQAAATEAAERIIDVLSQEDYLSENGTVILLSVESRNENRASIIRKTFASELEEGVRSVDASGLILSQTISRSTLSDSDTPGKATLLQTLVQDYPDLDVSELSDFSVDELFRQLLDEDIDLREYTDFLGELPADIAVEDDNLDESDNDDTWENEYYNEPEDEVYLDEYEDEEYFDDSEDEEYYDDSEDEEYYDEYEDEEYYDDSEDEEYYDDSEDEEYYDDSEDEEYYDESEDEEYYDESGNEEDYYTGDDFTGVFG